MTIQSVWSLLSSKLNYTAPDLLACDSASISTLIFPFVLLWLYRYHVESPTRLTGISLSRDSTKILRPQELLAYTLILWVGSTLLFQQKLTSSKTCTVVWMHLFFITFIFQLIWDMQCRVEKYYDNSSETEKSWTAILGVDWLIKSVRKHVNKMTILSLLNFIAHTLLPFASPTVIITSCSILFAWTLYEVLRSRCQSIPSFDYTHTGGDIDTQQWSSWGTAECLQWIVQSQVSVNKHTSGPHQSSNLSNSILSAAQVQAFYMAQLIGTDLPLLSVHDWQNLGFALGPALRLRHAVQEITQLSSPVTIKSATNSQNTHLGNQSVPLPVHTDETEANFVSVPGINGDEKNVVMSPCSFHDCISSPNNKDDITRRFLELTRSLKNNRNNDRQTNTINTNVNAAQQASSGEKRLVDDTQYVPDIAPTHRANPFSPSTPPTMQQIMQESAALMHQAHQLLQSNQSLALPAIHKAQNIGSATTSSTSCTRNDGESSHLARECRSFSKRSRMIDEDIDNVKSNVRHTASSSSEDEKFQDHYNDIKSSFSAAASRVRLDRADEEVYRPDLTLSRSNCKRGEAKSRVSKSNIDEIHRSSSTRKDKTMDERIAQVRSRSERIDSDNEYSRNVQVKERHHSPAIHNNTSRDYNSKQSVSQSKTSESADNRFKEREQTYHSEERPESREPSNSKDGSSRHRRSYSRERSLRQERSHSKERSMHRKRSNSREEPLRRERSDSSRERSGRHERTSSGERSTRREEAKSREISNREDHSLHRERSKSKEESKRIERAKSTEKSNPQNKERTKSDNRHHAEKSDCKREAESGRHKSTEKSSLRSKRSNKRSDKHQSHADNSKENIAREAKAPAERVISCNVDYLSQKQLYSAGSIAAASAKQCFENTCCSDIPGFVERSIIASPVGMASTSSILPFRAPNQKLQSFPLMAPSPVLTISKIDKVLASPSPKVARKKKKVIERKLDTMSSTSDEIGLSSRSSDGVDTYGRKYDEDSDITELLSKGFSGSIGHGNSLIEDDSSLEYRVGW